MLEFKDASPSSIVAMNEYLISIMPSYHPKRPIFEAMGSLVGLFGRNPAKQSQWLQQVLKIAQFKHHIGVCVAQDKSAEAKKVSLAQVYHRLLAVNSLLQTLPTADQAHKKLDEACQDAIDNIVKAVQRLGSCYVLYDTAMSILLGQFARIGVSLIKHSSSLLQYSVHLADPTEQLKRPTAFLRHLAQLTSANPVRLFRDATPRQSTDHQLPSTDCRKFHHSEVIQPYIPNCWVA